MKNIFKGMGEGKNNKQISESKNYNQLIMTGYLSEEMHQKMKELNKKRVKSH